MRAVQRGACAASAVRLYGKYVRANCVSFHAHRRHCIRRTFLTLTHSCVRVICTRTQLCSRYVGVRVYRKLVLLQTSGYRWKLTTPLIVMMGICARVPTLNIYFIECYSRTLAKHKLQMHITYEPCDLVFSYNLTILSHEWCAIIQCIKLSVRVNKCSMFSHKNITLFEYKLRQFVQSVCKNKDRSK